MKSIILVEVAISLYVVAQCRSALVTARSQGAVDLTLVADASGESVVDACIQKLSTLKTLSNDFGFIKRIAFVESEFGKSKIGRNNLHGIWQITTDIQQQIVSLSPVCTSATILAEAVVKFGKDIANMSNSDFRIPLRSALAARLFIEIRSSSNLPATLPDQAAWWAANYNLSQPAQQFEALVSSYEKASVCQVRKMDIWFLIDGSGSIGSGNFRTTLQFVASLSAEFPISPNGVRAGFSVYSSLHTFRSHFDEDASNSNFSQVVLSTSYPGGGTGTGAAITEVVTSGFNESSGLQPLSEGVPRVLIVLTDGQSGDDVIPPAELARNKSITVFGVGVGNGINEDELNEIANDPDSTHVFKLQRFDDLLSVLKQSLTEKACDVSVEIPDSTSVPVDLPAGQRYYSTVQLPVNGSIVLVFVVGSNGGRGVLYISLTSVNPNSALFDFSFKINAGTTTITINDGDDQFGSVLAGSQTRTKRSISSSPNKDVYTALEADKSSPLTATFKATGSLTKAVSENKQQLLPPHLRQLQDMSDAAARKITSIILLFSPLLVTIPNAWDSL